mmetsp:Transcript_80583/g.218214  ORF Transcript_80583/g.218214 Transcript_80583/m.218214 type:complete len:281 (+) Transcript_80583:387-1229(+)
MRVADSHGRRWIALHVRRHGDVHEVCPAQRARAGHVQPPAQALPVEDMAAGGPPDLLRAVEVLHADAALRILLEVICIELYYFTLLQSAFRCCFIRLDHAVLKQKHNKPVCPQGVDIHEDVEDDGEGRVDLDGLVEQRRGVAAGVRDADPMQPDAVPRERQQAHEHVVEPHVPGSWAALGGVVLATQLQQPCVHGPEATVEVVRRVGAHNYGPRLERDVALQVEVGHQGVHQPGEEAQHDRQQDAHQQREDEDPPVEVGLDNLHLVGPHLPRVHLLLGVA